VVQLHLKHLVLVKVTVVVAGRAQSLRRVAALVVEALARHIWWRVCVCPATKARSAGSRELRFAVLIFEENRE
jgi:hypothetical protein